MRNFLAANPFGTINAPPGVNKFSGGGLTGIGLFLSLILRTMVVGAGIYALFNLLIAGYQFLGAGGDPKAVAAAWARIWQSILGVTITAAAFVIAALIGILLFGDWRFILFPSIYGV